MTILGVDTSNHDIIDRNGGRNLDWVAIARAGVTFCWHKVSDGLYFYADPTAQMALTAMRATLPIWGGYHVLWGNRSITAQLDWFASILDHIVPGWRGDPHFVAVWDCEPFGYNTAPGVDQVNQAGDYWRQATGRPSLAYCPPWVYGADLNRLRYPLISSAYGKNDPGALADLYPGDGTSRWQATPQRQADVLQYGSRAVVGPHSDMDADAFSGTLDQLRALVTGDSMLKDELISIPSIDGKGTETHDGATTLGYANRNAWLGWQAAASGVAKIDALTTLVGQLLTAQGTEKADVQALLDAVKAIGQPTDAQIAAQADRIAATLVASNANGLTQADHAAVVADVKQALREGVGNAPATN